MKNKLTRLASALILTLGMAASANATPIDQLIDRGNGMIYDTHQDLTWLQDVNYAQTSGYDANGRMNWSTATDWAAGLSYGGYDDWRLPSVTDDGNNGCQKDDGTYDNFNGSDCGYNVDTFDSELAYMWYNILGNTPYYDTSGNGRQSGWGLTSTSADGVDILNIQLGRYWSGTEYALNTSGAWEFNTNIGIQYASNKNREFYAWAVRSGDVDAIAVPEPGTLLLLAVGLAGIAGTKRRRC